MEQDENNTLIENSELKNVCIQIKKYLETDIRDLKREIDKKNSTIINLKDELNNAQHLNEGNRQLINKLLGDLSKLQNDNDWYKRTYEQRSFLGTIRQKIFRK